MKAIVLVGFATLAVACGHSTSDDAAAPASSASHSGASARDAAQGSGSGGPVTLIGCLQGPTVPGATGTAGVKPGERAAGAHGNDAGVGKHGAATDAYVLSNVTVENTAVGSNGAGGSGGPLVSDGTSFELDGVPADAQVGVNKRVRVTGRVDERSAGGVEAGSTPGTRDDTKANSLTVAGDSATRRIRVETMQVVAPDCSSAR